MKRRRTVSDDEEEEEKDMCKRNSLCKRETISCVPLISDTNEQLGPSTQLQRHNQRTHGKKLRVTCGVKKGSLDVEKLAKGEDCILCERKWLSPTAFEAYAGKGSFKKWKASIFYNDEPLQTLFDEGILTTKKYRGRRTSTTKPQKILSSDAESGSSYEVALNAIELYSGGETKEDDVQGGWVLGKGEKKRQGAESGGGDVKTTEEEEDKKKEGEIEDAMSRLLQKRILKAKRRKGRRTGTEIYSGQETVGDDVQGNDWLPVKEEKERQEAESGGDVNTTEGKETEELEIEVESVPAVSDEGNINNSVCEEMQTDFITPTRGKRAARVVLKRLKEESPERQSNCPEPEQPKEDNYEEHLETSVQPSENIKNSSPGKECPEPMSHSPKPLRKQADKSTHTDATTNDHEAAQIQKMNQETSDPQASHSSDIEEVSSSRCSAGIDLETMDLNQLKKENIKMQIKVLKLREEYYTMKIQQFTK